MVQSFSLNKNGKVQIQGDLVGREICDVIPCRTILRDLFSFYCSILNTSHVCYKGSYALLHHVRTAEHKENVKNVDVKIMPNQLHLSGASSMEIGKLTKVPMNFGAYLVWDETTVAEITWTLKMIESGYSGKSADGIAYVVGKMFRDTVVKNIFFWRTKFAYFLTEALGPHFRKMTLDEVSNSYYIVEF